MPNHDSPETLGFYPGRAEFIRRACMVVLMISALAAGALLLWLAAEVFLLFFASVLLALFLRGLADWTSRWTGLGSGWSLFAVLVGMVIFFALVGWLLVNPITTEVAQLQEQLPDAVRQLQRQVAQYSWGRDLVQRLQPAGVVSHAGTLLSQAKSVFSITVHGIVDALVVLFCGFYLSTDPQFYVDGFIQLVPRDRRERYRTVLHEIGVELRAWLFGQIISMSIIGILTWVGLYLLGIPAAAAVAVLAGLLDFVPVVGPWVAGIIACVLAFLRSPMHSVYVACLFLGLHFFEGHILIPQVQRRATRLPPVLTILSMVLFYELFGLLGLFLATPLLAFILVTIKALYVQDVIETDHSVEVLRASA